MLVEALVQALVLLVWRSPRQTPLQQIHVRAGRIFRARSTTIADVTRFMQA